MSTLPRVPGEVLRLAAQKLHQLDHVGRPEFKKHDAPFHFLRNEPHRRTDDDELAVAVTALVDVAQAAPDLGRFPQWLVEILEVEDGGAFVRDDEVQSGARRLRAGPAWLRHRDSSPR